MRRVQLDWRRFLISGQSSDRKRSRARAVDRERRGTIVPSISTLTRPSPDPLYIDLLRAAWKRLGVQFTIQPSLDPVDVEALIVETATVGDADERLFVGAASWLACYHGFVNGRRLSALVAQIDQEVTAYVGALLSLARDAPDGARRAPELDAAFARCLALPEPRPLYEIMNTLPVLRERVRVHTLPLYAQWGLWHDEAILKLESVRPLAWLLRVPELRARAMLGHFG